MFGQQVGCPHCQASVLIQASVDTGHLAEPEVEVAPVIVTDTPESKRKKNKKNIVVAPAKDNAEDEKDSNANRFKTRKKRAIPPMLDSTSKQARPNQPLVDEPETADRVEAPTETDKSPSLPDQIVDLTEARKESIDHLLPPRFDVPDPSRLPVDMRKRRSKVLLPDGEGGTTQFDERVMRVEHEGHQFSLVSLSPEQKARRRLIQNIIAIVIGIIIMAVAFTILG